MTFMADYEKRITCPGCGQGWVVPLKVIANSEVLFVCEECETTWLRQDDIENETVAPTNFRSYMRSHGLEGVWSEVERLSSVTGVRSTR